MIIQLKCESKDCKRITEVELNTIENDKYWQCSCGWQGKNPFKI